MGVLKHVGEKNTNMEYISIEDGSTNACWWKEHQQGVGKKNTNMDYWSIFNENAWWCKEHQHL